MPIGSAQSFRQGKGSRESTQLHLLSLSASKMLKYQLAEYFVVYWDIWIVENFRDGAALCGVYIAASNIMDMIECEDEVDVFYAVQQIKAVRPEFISEKVKTLASGIIHAGDRHLFCICSRNNSCKSIGSSNSIWNQPKTLLSYTQMHGVVLADSPSLMTVQYSAIYWNFIQIYIHKFRALYDVGGVQRLWWCVHTNELFLLYFIFLYIFFFKPQS